MSGQRGEWRRWIESLAQRFREKGATSPESAMTAGELGVHEMFERAMKRRLGQTGIFVDVGGRYYLNEARLREFEQMPGPPSRALGWLLAFPIGLVVALLIFLFLVTSGHYFLGEFLVILLVVVATVFVVRLQYRRSRMNYWRGRSRQPPLVGG